MKRLRPLLLAAIFLCSPVGSLSGQMRAVAIQANQIVIDARQFEAWVFNNDGNAEQGRRRIEQELRARIRELERVGDLSPAQVSKLEIAGRVDVERFFDAVETAKMTVKLGAMPQDQINQVWQVAQPLQQRLNRGLLGKGSVFEKTLRCTLNSAQRAKYDELERQRLLQQYRAMVRAAIATLETGLPLTEEQRSALLELTLSQSRYTHFGSSRHQDVIFVFYQWSQLPEADLRGIFPEPREWEQLSQLIQRAKGYRQNFEQQGLLGEVTDE
jgi:hypothetical protein